MANPILNFDGKTALPGENGADAHWTPNRKAELIRRVRAGEIEFEVACGRFDISEEELEGWMTRETAFGMRGLSVMRLQHVGRRHG